MSVSVFPLSSAFLLILVLLSVPAELRILFKLELKKNFQIHLTSLRHLDYLNFEQCTTAVFISMLPQFQFSYNFSWWCFLTNKELISLVVWKVICNISDGIMHCFLSFDIFIIFWYNHNCSPFCYKCLILKLSLVSQSNRLFQNQYSLCMGSLMLKQCLFTFPEWDGLIYSCCYKRHATKPNRILCIYYVYRESCLY